MAHLRCVAALILSFSMLLTGSTPSTAAATYRLSTDWFFDPAFAPILLAQRAGYFARAKLNVSIIQGTPGLGNMQALAAGKVDFLYGALHYLPSAVDSGLQVKCVAVFTHVNENAIVVRRDSGIHGIKDLAGKTVGQPVGGGANYAMFPDVLRSAGVDPATVKVVAVDYPILGPGLLSGKFDAINVYYTTTPLLESQGSVIYFPYKDNGFNFLDGYGLIVRSEMLKGRPDDVRAMVAVLLRAWADTARNPGGTIDAAAQSKYSASFVQRKEMVRYMELELQNLQTAETVSHGLGYSTKDEWQSLLDVMQKYGGLRKVLSPDTYYTNDFLPHEPIHP